jgi:type II secretory pathway predicted ATPase ExeA
MSPSTQRNANAPMTQFFELRRQPFPQTLHPKEMYALPQMEAVSGMTEFAFQNSMFYAIIGAVGCGKSSALRFACDRLAQHQAMVLEVVGGIWSFTEFLRQILAALGIEFKPYQPSVMVRLIQERLIAIQNDGKKCILIVDEAHLLRGDVYAQLHILSQHPEAKRPLFSLMLCGQEELAEKLSYPQARPLMSRIAEGFYMQPLGRDDFDGYIGHHMRLAGAKGQVFDAMALDALWQCSNGNLRSIGNHALSALQYAANTDCRMVTAECVRKSQRALWGQPVQPVTDPSAMVQARPGW